MKVTKDTTIGELLEYDIHAAKFLFAIGMHCVGCPSSRGESLEEACLVHGVDVEKFLAELNAFLADFHQDAAK